MKKRNIGVSALVEIKNENGIKDCSFRRNVVCITTCEAALELENKVTFPKADYIDEVSKDFRGLIMLGCETKKDYRRLAKENRNDPDLFEIYFSLYKSLKALEKKLAKEDQKFFISLIYKLLEERRKYFEMKNPGFSYSLD